MLMRRLLVAIAMVALLLALALPAFAQDYPPDGTGDGLLQRSAPAEQPARVEQRPDEGLAGTGADVGRQLAAGVGLATVGGVILVATRRRRRAAQAG
jgi:hypothetical protein